MLNSVEECQQCQKCQQCQQLKRGATSISDGILLYQNSYRAIYLLSTYQAVKASTSFSFGYLDWWIYDVSHQSLGDRGHMVREGHV